MLTLVQAVTFNATVSGLTISATWAKVYWTLKESIYDDDDQTRLLKQICESRNINTEKYPVPRLRYGIDRAKNRLLGPEDDAGPHEAVLEHAARSDEHIPLDHRAPAQHHAGAGATIVRSTPSASVGSWALAARQPWWRSAPANGGSPLASPMTRISAGSKPLGTVTRASSRMPR